MHYYKYNIDKFNAATRHLTRVERSLYRDAIDVYYKLEQPLNSDLKRLSRLLLAHSEEEKEALSVVLDEFFYLTDDGYVNDHCEEVLVEYRSNKDDKSIAGQVSAATKKINKLERYHTKKINDLIADKENEKAQKSINECLTEIQQVLNACSTEVQQRFNSKATHSQLTNKLNNLLTNKLSKGSNEPMPKQVWHSEQREKISDAYNLAIANTSKSKFSKWTDKRIKKLETRCTKDKSRTLDWWLSIIDDIPNHAGAVDGDWFTLDFLLESEDRLTKYIEGKYRKSFVNNKPQRKSLEQKAQEFVYGK